jgi:hypothetical protein
MIDMLSREDLRTLVEMRQKPCVSVFLPTHRAGTQSQEDRIRLKNLLTEAEERIVALDVRATEARQMLQPAWELLDAALFWQEQSDGLAIFLSPGFFRVYRLPLAFAELLVVSDRFHVKRLLQMFHGDGHFYVLALSLNEVRLLVGSRYSVSPVELQNVPSSMSDALKYDDQEKQLQFHTQTQSRQGGRGALFHGHGEGADGQKSDILRYFHQVDRGLRELLADETAPLVLAGVEYLLPIYREANAYPGLMAETVNGNPETLDAETLQQQAWDIVAPHFRQAQQAAVARYLEFSKGDRASDDICVILPAAHYGRVDTLLVALGVHHWGRFDADAGQAELHTERQPGDEDLLDHAAVETLLRQGQVFALPQDEMPDGATVAAIFRY